MVVVCESCSTRFRIDDAQIPAKGRLVRCSQCKATFIAKPGDASFEEAVEEVVAEVTDAGGSPVPEPAADLFEAGGGDLDDPATRGELDDERWEFDEAPGTPARDASRSTPFDEPTEPPTAPSALEEVGDPAEWDLLRDVAPVARETKFVEPREEAPPPVRSAPPERRAAPEPFLEPAVARPPPARRPEVGSALARGARAVFAAAAWVVLAAIAVSSVAPLLASDAALHAVIMKPRTLPLAGGEARAVRGGFVENAFGALYVIQGELARAGTDAGLGLRVHLVDATGRRVGTPHWAGVAPSAQDLREVEPRALRDELDASAATAALGGPFAVFFEALPAGAASFELALETLPEPPAPSAAEPAPEAPPAAPAAAEPMASSAPPPRPSSG